MTERPRVSREFWIGMHNALLIQLAFVLIGLALARLWGCR